MSGIQLPIGIETVNPVDADYKRGPWPTIAAAKAGIPLALRYNQLTFYVVGDANEYYWLDTDLSDSGVLIKTSSGGQTENFNWKFSTNTTAVDPGTGKFRLNNSNPLLATQMYVNSICDGTGLDIDTIFSAINGTFSIYVQDTSDATKFIQFTTVGPYTNNGGWWTIPITSPQVGSGGLFANNKKCVFYITNKNGSTGGSSLPIVHQVYLVEDPSDAILMGGITSNVYTTAQAAYNAADILSAGGTIAVVIMIGKTTAAVVGSITLTTDWNAMISLSGISAFDSAIDQIIGDNNLGTAFGATLNITNLTIQLITCQGTGAIGDGGFVQISGTGYDIFFIYTGTTGIGGTAGTIQVSNQTFFAPTTSNRIRTIDVTVTDPVGGNSGNIYLQDDTLYVDQLLYNAANGGSLDLYGCTVKQINVDITVSSGSNTVFKRLKCEQMVLNHATPAFFYIFDCNLGNVTFGTTVGTSNMYMYNTSFNENLTVGGAILEFTSVTSGYRLRAYNCTFGRIANLPSLAKIFNSSIIRDVATIGTTCSIINTSITGNAISTAPCITNATAVTVIFDNSTYTTAPNATVTFTRAASVIPKTRYVYLVQDAADLLAMGDRHNNVYTTFQAAYDAANVLQVALGGTNIVVIQVGNITAAVSGNLTLTANYNRFVQINGISPNSSVLGNIIATNAVGNGFTIGVNAANPVALKDITIGTISTNATGTTGNSGAVSLRLAGATIGNVNTSITNILNITGNGGNFTSNTTLNFFSNIGSIITSSQSTTTSAGNISISASSLIVGAITTAQNNLGGSIGVISLGSVITIASITTNTLSIASINLLRVTVTSVVSIITLGSFVFTDCTFTAGATLETTSVSAVTLTMINTKFSNTLLTQNLITTIAKGCVIAGIDDLGSDSKLDNCVIDGGVNNAINIVGTNCVFQNCSIKGTSFGGQIDEIGAGCSFYNCSITGGLVCITNSVPVSVLFTSKFSSYENIPAVNVTLT